MPNDLLGPNELSGFPGAPFTDQVVDSAVAALRAAAGWHIAPSRTETVAVDCGKVRAWGDTDMVLVLLSGLCTLCFRLELRLTTPARPYAYM